MPQSNPYLKHRNRAPYEIGVLLRKLERCAHDQKNNDEIAEAIIQHSYSAHLTILHGLEAIGCLLYHAACNNEVGHIAPEVLNDIGLLIRHLAVETQFLFDVEQMMKEDMGGGRV